MDTKPIVTVVMPAYNCEKYIEQAAKSVLLQTVKNLELLIVDDCSSDNTRKIADDIAKADNRVKVIYQNENSGVSNARNTGIINANGAWIALLDSDDYWMPDKLEKQLCCAQQTGADIVYCSYGFVDENGREYGGFIVPDKTDFEATLSKSVISCSTCMIRTELFCKNLFTNEYYHEDLYLWLCMLQQGAIARGTTDILAYYRQVNGSRSNDKIHSAIERWKIFRQAFHLPFFYSCRVFLIYAFGGLVKYKLRKEA